MQHADDCAKRLVLNACINDSFHYYRKSAGTKYEKEIRDKLYNFWSKYIPVLGDDIFEADWLAGYLEISGERSLKNVVIRPSDLARKTIAKQNVPLARKSLNEELNAKQEKELEELRQLREEAKQLKAELTAVKTGWSFRIGRFLTWIPRKFLGRP